MDEIEWREPGGEGPQWEARAELEGLTADLGVDDWGGGITAVYVAVRIPGELPWNLTLVDELNATVDEAKRCAEGLAPLALAKAKLLRNAERLAEEIRETPASSERLTV
jgi:hypothetical protein